jgi:PAS domain S-box-containing protein
LTTGDETGLAETAPVGLFEADGDMIIRGANTRLAKMVGLSREDLVGRPLRTLLTRSSQFVYALKVEHALLTDGAAEEIFLELDHTDGRARAVLLTVTLDDEDTDRRHGALFSAPERRAYELELIAARQAVVEKINEQNLAKKALGEANERLEQLVAERTAALGQRDLLLREVYHRVKNNLQVVDGLLFMRARQLGDPAAKAAMEEIRKRVFALGLVHHQLMGSKDLKTFDVGAFLKELIAHLRADAPENVNLALDVAPLAVDLDFAVPLGLLVTELATNALKHAFPGRAGEISVSLSATNDREVVLCVTDNGVGLPPDFQKQRTSGLSIVDGLVRQLGGRIEAIQTKGVCWEAHLPTPRTA